MCDIWHTVAFNPFPAQVRASDEVWQPLRIPVTVGGEFPHTGAPIPGLLDYRPTANAYEEVAAGMPKELVDLLRCPITQAVMRHPVIAGDGHTYEKDAIVTWIDERGLISPVTQEALPHDEYTLHENMKIRLLIEGLVEENQKQQEEEKEGEEDEGEEKDKPAPNKPKPAPKKPKPAPKKPKPKKEPKPAIGEKKKRGPKRGSTTGYIEFSKMIRPGLPYSSFSETSQLIGAKWKELDSTEKDEWRERAKKLNASLEDGDEGEMPDGERDDAVDGEMHDGERDDAVGGEMRDGDDDGDELSIPKMLEGAKKRKARKERIAMECDEKVEAMMDNGVRVNPLFRQMYDEKKGASSSAPKRRVIHDADDSE